MSDPVTDSAPPTDDAEAITALLLRYADRLDAGDLAGVGALFGHSTYRTSGTDYVLTGAAEVAGAQQAMVRLYDGVPRTHHNITNISIDVAEDRRTATSRCYFTVMQAVPDEDICIIAFGRYEDTLERVADEWRFTDRLIHLDQMADMSKHLRLDGIDLA